MKIQIAAALLMALSTACAASEEIPQPIEMAQQPTAAKVRYVTPTSAPTLVPTAVRMAATAMPTSTPEPSLDMNLDCENELERRYARASDLYHFK